jgi:hypothetical protein
MKVQVTQEHYDRAMKASEEFDPDRGDLWGQCCLIAQACKDAGVNNPCVSSSVVYINVDRKELWKDNGLPHYVLPQNARRALNEFDRVQDDPARSFSIELPFEFELGELFAGKDG